MKLLLKILLMIGLIGVWVGCNKTQSIDKRPSPNGEQEPDLAKDGGPKVNPNQKFIQLKSGSMLAQSIFRTLGRGKTLRNQDLGKVDLMDEYKQNLGGTSNLRIGEIYADSPSASYMLALSIVANNAAKVCTEDTANYSQDASLCDCSDPATAEAMLKRALPYLSFEDEKVKTVSSAFALECAKDSYGAIASLISSLAFAARL
jgi:hypothetical protein